MGSLKPVSRASAAVPSARCAMAAISWVFLVAVAIVSLAQAAPGGDKDPSDEDELCGRCDPSACPADSSACPFGLAAPDPCGCCLQGVCGLAEGDKCFDKALPLPRRHLRFGLCGEDLSCEMRHDLRRTDEPEAICVCKEQEPVCGSNNRTYDTMCGLRRDAARTTGGGDQLVLKHRGPCASAPWVISGPQDQHSSVHSSLALDCEVKGYPTPNIVWEFKGADGSFKVLPSDDLYVAVQVRGGPEPFMATSWVQIVDLRPSDSGVYTCVAGNSEGTARASAAVSAR